MAVILHTDDSSFSRLQIGKVLKKAGYELLHADSGKAALALLAEKTPDLIITDILMPEMDGIALLEALKAQGSSIPVMVVTADVQDDTRATCLALGAFELINKPPKDEELLAAVAQGLGRGTV